jgi:hypothetical protein
MSLIEKPKASNSTVTLLSRVRDRTERRFLTRDGETRMFFRERGFFEVAMVEEAR